MCTVLRCFCGQTNLLKHKYQVLIKDLSIRTFQPANRAFKFGHQVAPQTYFGKLAKWWPKT